MFIASSSGMTNRLCSKEENKSIDIRYSKHAFIFQLRIINSILMWMSLVIIGDYGVGKTLLLDAAAKKLADKKVPVYFFCALDYEHNDKVTDDVLDVIFRSEF